MTAVAVNSLHAFVLASRPKTLGAMACPVLMGSAFALKEGTFSLTVFALTMTAALLLQVLANLINDYADFFKGGDSKARLGPPRAMQMGWIKKAAMEKFIAVVLLLSICLGLPLALRGGLPIVLCGLGGIFLCGFYSLGKKSLSYLGFSEIVVFMVFGPLSMQASYYVHNLTFSLDVLWASIAPGLLSTALILTNNLRDSDEDKKNHKRTIAVRFGEGFARKCIVLCIIGAGLSVFVAFFSSYSPLVIISCVALLFPASRILMILYAPISKDFNLMLMALGKSLYLFGILFSLGLLYGA